MNQVIQRLIGSYAQATPPSHSLAQIVERELTVGRFSRSVSEFLAELPEKPQDHTVHVVSLSEEKATCSALGRVKDHENPRYFDAQVIFEVDLKTGACLLRSQQGVV